MQKKHMLLSLVVGLGAVFLSGCMSLIEITTPTREISKDEALMAVKQFQSSLSDIQYDKYIKERTTFIQPDNIKQKCLIPEMVRLEGEKIYWDGKCEKGYGKGLGRVISITDSSQEDSILDLGNFAKDKRLVGVTVKTSSANFEYLAYISSYNEDYLLKDSGQYYLQENLSSGEMSNIADYVNFDNEEHFSLNGSSQSGINIYTEVDNKMYPAGLDRLIINIENDNAWVISATEDPYTIYVMEKDGSLKELLHIVEEGNNVNLQSLFADYFSALNNMKSIYTQMYNNSPKMLDDLLNKYKYYKANYAKRPQGVSMQQYEALYAKLYEVSQLIAQRKQQQQEYQRQEQIKQAQIDAYRAKQAAAISSLILNMPSFQSKY